MDSPECFFGGLTVDTPECFFFGGLTMDSPECFLVG